MVAADDSDVVALFGRYASNAFVPVPDHPTLCDRVREALLLRGLQAVRFEGEGRRAYRLSFGVHRTVLSGRMTRDEEACPGRRRERQSRLHRDNSCVPAGDGQCALARERMWQPAPPNRAKTHTTCDCAICEWQRTLYVGCGSPLDAGRPVKPTGREHGTPCSGRKPGSCNPGKRRHICVT